MNRRERRATMHDLRRLGCTCTPDIAPVAEADLVRGATSGVHVWHQTGCPLGDQAARFNRAGLVPALFTSATRCER